MTSSLATATAVVAFLGALVALVIGIVQLIKMTRERGEPRPEPRKKSPARKWFISSVVFLVIGAGFVAFQVIFPTPTVAITSPLHSVNVTAEGASVRFLVRGISTHVVGNPKLGICVLVFSAPDWHVQRRASLMPGGDWELAQAWIGDATAPVRKGDSIRILAVVTSSACQQNQEDRKVKDPYELDPKAVSAEVSPVVESVAAATPAPPPPNP